MVKNPLHRYREGKELYSNGRQSPATLSSDGWVVAPWIPVTDQQRMSGASIMRWAIVKMIESGDPLNEEVSVDLAHALRSLNHGQITGVFIPSVSADTHEVISQGLEDAEEAREEIASSLQESNTVPADWAKSLLDTMVAADYGHIKGLAAPFSSHSTIMDADRDQAPEEQKQSKDDEPKGHIKYLAILHRKNPEATAKELLRCCIDDARKHQDTDDESFPFYMVSDDIALKGKKTAINGKTFSNWLTDAKKII